LNKLTEKALKKKNVLIGKIKTHCRRLVQAKTARTFVRKNKGEKPERTEEKFFSSNRCTGEPSDIPNHTLARDRENTPLLP
jgi:hypothetical protein